MAKLRLVVLGLAFELHSVPENHLPIGLKRQGHMGIIRMANLYRQSLQLAFVVFY